MAGKFRNKYRIPSSRAYWWDYANNGGYFVTICTKDHQHFFGEVQNEKMQLSSIGELAKKYWTEIPKQFTFAYLSEYVIMPNHLHGIVVINGSRRDAINRVSTNNDKKSGGVTGQHNPMLHNNLSRIIRWYKGRTSFESKKINDQFTWQTRFHDHIIRNEEAFQRIAKYINENPLNWKGDKYYKG